MNSGTPTTAASAGGGEAPLLDLSGRTLADYRVLRKLGQGGMGQVYLAEQVSLKRKVALKILRPDVAARSQALARFKAEAEAVARATHANIVQVYAYGEVEGLPYIALEYVEGRNLKDFLQKKGPPELPVALSIMRQVAAALQRAAELGIIHRDVKPENILLTRKGEVKVADFGLSRVLEGDRPAVNLTQSGVTMGTPLYMSPEQVEGKSLDPRTDIYSFGVTCYHMLGGQPPFRGETAFEVALQHVQKQPAPLASLRPDLPEALCAIVHKMMAKDPGQRYQTGRDLLRDVARVREGLSGTAATGQPTSLLEPLLATAVSDSTSGLQAAVAPARRGWLMAAFVLTMVAAAAVGVAVAWRERRQERPLADRSPPADAAAVETILLPNRREQALRLLVDQALNPPPKQLPDVGAVANCLELGLYYLEGNRLQEAEALFQRVSAFQKPEAYFLLGQVGQAIVLALRDKPQESNRLLVEVFAPPMPFRLLGLPKKTKKPLPRPGDALVRRIEVQHLSPIRFLLDHPRARDWLGRARLCNRNNGLREDEVPTYLLIKFPLAG